MSKIELGCDPVTETPPGNRVEITVDASTFDRNEQSYKLHIANIHNQGSAVSLRFVVRIGDSDTPEVISDEAVLQLGENEELSDQLLVSRPLEGKPINPSGWHVWLCLLKDGEVCPSPQKGGPSCCGRI